MLADLGSIFSILRAHIIAIAVVAALAFGWTFTGEYPWAAAFIGGVDWLLINLLNRVTDLKEDLANEIRGSQHLVGRARWVMGVWIGILVASFAGSWWLAPSLTGWRIAVQVVGVAYSVRLVPTTRGLKRIKDLYFFKNFMSAMLFVATVFVYPMVVRDWAFVAPASMATWLVLVCFFVPFEITYEILYDMRDLEGDRLAGVPTYPVVHGLVASRRIVDMLLAAAAGVLIVGFGLGAIGLRDGLMIVAPGVQLAFYRPRFARGLTRADCIQVTWLGAGLLAVWLVGTSLWIAAGLPPDVRL